MIDLTKEYKTRGGHDVVLYCDDAPGAYPVHGRVMRDSGYNVETWTATGRHYDDDEETDMDLVLAVETPPVEAFSRLEDARAIVALYKSLRSACEKAIDAGCLDIEGPLHEAIWFAFEGMMDIINIEGLSWWIWDNACGENAMELGGRRITTLEQLEEVL
jgi:hypothetical protein